MNWAEKIIFKLIVVLIGWWMFYGISLLFGAVLSNNEKFFLYLISTCTVEILCNQGELFEQIKKGK